MSHILSIEDLINFETSKQIAGAFGNGENKSLKISNYIDEYGDIETYFIVEHERKTIMKCTRLYEAIEKYNSL